MLIIPERFERTLTRGEIAEVQVLVDGVDASTASTVTGYVTGVAASYNGTRVREYLASAAATGMPQNVRGFQSGSSPEWMAWSMRMAWGPRISQPSNPPENRCGRRGLGAPT